MSYKDCNQESQDYVLRLQENIVSLRMQLLDAKESLIEAREDCLELREENKRLKKELQKQGVGDKVSLDTSVKIEGIEGKDSRLVREVLKRVLEKEIANIFPKGSPLDV
jgi:regulator of replication initiation timing